MNHGSVHGFVHGFVHGLVYGLVHGLVLWFGLWYMVYGVLNNVLLELGGLHCVLPCAVHPDLGHPPDNQEYLGLVSEAFNTTQTF